MTGRQPWPDALPAGTDGTVVTDGIESPLEQARAVADRLHIKDGVTHLSYRVLK